MTHAFNPCTLETEAGGSLNSSQCGLQSEFQDSLAEFFVPLSILMRNRVSTSFLWMFSLLRAGKVHHLCSWWEGYSESKQKHRCLLDYLLLCGGFCVRFWVVGESRRRHTADFPRPPDLSFIARTSVCPSSFPCQPW